jgi:hypothetical protein
MSDEVEITERLDRLIWRSIGKKSVRQIAAETGLSIEQVAQRKIELVDFVDEISIQQMRAKLIADLGDISEKTQKDYDSAPFEFKAGLMNSAIAAMKAIQAELSRLSKADQGRIDALNELRVRELVNLIREVVDISVSEAAERFDISEDDLFVIFNTNLAKAAQKRDMIE